MAIKLGANNYGKSRVRLLRVVKQQGRHDIKELTIRIRFEGDFEAAHTKGDNQKILPTDTMKNTVYVLARQYPAEAVEDFASHLIEHFLTYNPQVSRVRFRAVAKISGSRLASGRETTRHGLQHGGQTKNARRARWHTRGNHDSRWDRRSDRSEDDEVGFRRISCAILTQR